MKVERSPIFIVGSPRSGTTLLQSLLGSHTQVAAFPESRFFVFAVPNVKVLRSLGIAGKQVRARLREYLLSMGEAESTRYIPSYAIFIRQYTAAYVRIMDELAAKAGKQRWLDKTPRHLRYIPEIERYIGQVKFIHIIRNGPDTIASFYEISNQFPKLWGGPTTVEGCTKSWIRDVQISQAYADHPDHSVIYYSELVENPSRMVQGLCRFVEIDYEEQILERYKETAKQVSWTTESWKESVKKPIEPQQSRFHRALTETQQQLVLDRLEERNLLHIG